MFGMKPTGGVHALCRILAFRSSTFWDCLIQSREGVKHRACGPGHVYPYMTSIHKNTCEVDIYVCRITRSHADRRLNANTLRNAAWAVTLCLPVCAGAIGGGICASMLQPGLSCIWMQVAPRLPPMPRVCPRRVCPQEVLDGLFGPAALPRPVRITVIRTVEANVGTSAGVRGPLATVRVELPADASGRPVRRDDVGHRRHPETHLLPPHEADRA